MRLARAFDDGDRAFARLGVAIGEYWVEKRTAPHVAEALECLGGEIRLAGDPRIERFLAGIAADLSQGAARRVSERLALALQASLLIRVSPPAVADTFCASRLAGDWGHAFGTLPGSAPVDAIIATCEF